MHGGAVAALERRYRACLHDPGIVDLRRQHAVRRLGGHDHATAVGDDRPLVLHERVQRALVDGHVDQRIAVEVQRDLAPRRHRHRAERRGDHPVVPHRFAEQRDIAALPCSDPPLIDDGGRGRAGEVVLPGHEIRIGDVERRGDEPADIDLRAPGEQHARRIDDEDLPGRVDGAGDHARLITGDAIEGDRAGARLVEVDRLLRADGEALPVDDRLVGGLVDVCLLYTSRCV